ncbi:hypothetical protein, partial [Archangium sp.]|uniref:hypothetical protein n=1 Tax=Archangium sp. TaxID=1872627 RepID=UPI002D69F313
PGDVQPILDDLLDRRLLLSQNGKLLGLALREVSRIPDSQEEFPGGYTDVDGWRLTMGSEEPRSVGTL